MAPSKTVRVVHVDGQLFQKQGDGSLEPIADKSDYARVDAMTSTEVEASAKADPDAQPLTDEEWAKVQLDDPFKVKVSIRLDDDIVAWFKSSGRRYQTRINAVLRQYVEAQQRAE